MTANRKFGNVVLLAAFGGVLFVIFRILQPFLTSIFLTVVLFSLLAPLNDHLVVRFNGRRNLAALAVCLGLTMVLVLPLVVLAIAAARQAGGVYAAMQDPQSIAWLQSWANPANNRYLARIDGLLPGSLHIGDIWTKIADQAQSVAAAGFGVLLTVLSGILDFAVSYFIVFFGLFFLLRDSEYFASCARKISPLADKHERIFVERFRQVTQATVLGTVVTAAVQGTASGLIFVGLGVQNALLWGSLTGLFSLVPLVGAAVIWLPWSAYLMLIGSPYKAILLVVLQIVVVGSVDNILRPILIEGRVKMHTLLVFLSILGGINYFGILGMILGPLVFAMGLALFDFYLLDRPDSDERVTPDIPRSDAA
jgi:predicted PurR-regulated permease PerM